MNEDEDMVTNQVEIDLLEARAEKAEAECARLRKERDEQLSLAKCIDRKHNALLDLLAEIDGEGEAGR